MNQYRGAKHPALGHGAACAIRLLSWSRVQHRFWATMYSKPLRKGSKQTIQLKMLENGTSIVDDRTAWCNLDYQSRGMWSRVRVAVRLTMMSQILHIKTIACHARGRHGNITAMMLIPRLISPVVNRFVAWGVSPSISRVASASLPSFWLFSPHESKGCIWVQMVQKKICEKHGIW